MSFFKKRKVQIKEGNLVVNNIYIYILSKHHLVCKHISSYLFIYLYIIIFLKISNEKQNLNYKSWQVQ